MTQPSSTPSHHIHHDLRKLGHRIRGSDPMVAMRLDRYLGHRFPFLSRTRWQEKCRNGQVHNHHGPLKPTYRLQEGDQLFHHYPQALEPKINDGVFCIYHNHPIMATYKPPHLPMHEGGKYRQNTFYQICRNTWGTPWHAVHRLDRETSGVVVCAKTTAMRGALAHAFRQQSTAKVYFAIAMGTPPASRWSVHEPIGYTSQTTWRTKRWVDPSGKPATTHFQTISTYRNFVWLKIRPVHGRTHQIRIHAAYAGLPLVGDVRYHHDEEVFLRFLEEGYSPAVLAKIMAPRLCLHAASIQFQLTHGQHARRPNGRLSPPPHTTLSINTAIPYDMTWIWRKLIRSAQPYQAVAEFTRLQPQLHAAYADHHHIDLPKTLHYLLPKLEH